jgi:oligosaccharide repeat unit polymerase
MKKTVFKNSLKWTVVVIIVLALLPYERMTLESYLVVLIGSILGGIGLKVSKDIASPQVILIGAWGVSLFLTSLDVRFARHIDHFNATLNLNTWAIIFTAICAFYISSSIAMKPLFTKHRAEIGQVNLNWNKKKLDTIILVCFFVAFLVYSYALVRNGGLPAFSVNVNESRASFVPGSIGILLTFFQLVVVLATANILLYGFKYNKLNFILALVSLISAFLTTQRIAAIESVLMAFFMFLILWPYTPEEQRNRRKTPLLFAFSIFAVGFIALFVWVGQARGLDALQITNLDNVLFEQLYIYFGGPAPRNFQLILEGGLFAHINESRGSALFFRPILWFIGFRDEVTLNDTFRGPNNATALFHYYTDLGLAGIIIFPLFWGTMVGLVYGRFRRRPSVKTGVVYVILANAIYFFPLSERFSEPSTFVKLVLFTTLIAIVYKIDLTIKKRYFYNNV